MPVIGLHDVGVSDRRNNPLIPAKAGIQIFKKSWVPAYAGTSAHGWLRLHCLVHPIFPNTGNVSNSQ